MDESQVLAKPRDAHASRGTSTPMRGLGGRLQAGAPFLDAVERAWASASRRRLVPQNFEQAAQRYAQLRRVSPVMLRASSRPGTLTDEVSNVRRCSPLPSIRQLDHAC